jgi:hypothetical protein
MATKITDHADAAKARLIERRKKPQIKHALDSFNQQTQALEDAIYQLLTERQLNTAIGEQLEGIGEIVGQPRNGLSDDDYRRTLKARVSANNSEGRIEDLIKVTRGIVNDASLSINPEQQFPASVLVRVEGGLIAGATADLAIEFLRDTRSGGVQIQLHYTPVAPDDTFTCGPFTTYDASTLPGITFLKVQSTAGFPASGTVIINPAEATEETLTYTHKDATTLYLSGSTSNFHVTSEHVVLPLSTTQGFADSVTPTSGGYLSSVVE